MTSQANLPPVAKWLLMTQDQVLDQFQSLKNSFTDGKDQKRFVFVEGTRDDRALIVAHADTVWLDTKISLACADNTLFSLDRAGERQIDGRKRYGVGIGADDRAGCAIAWELRKLGHSVLITSGEEKGCIATKFIMSSEYWRNKLNKTHQFMVQFDRRNSRDLVFYDVATKDFAKYVKEETGYNYESGSCSDISHLAKDISAVNISCGYYDEHHSTERLSISQWENTLATAKAWLSKKGLPKHELDRSNLFRYWETKTYSNNNNYYQSSMYRDDYDSDYYHGWNNFGQNKGTSTVVKKQKISTDFEPVGKAAKAIQVDGQELLQCPHCSEEVTEEDWYATMFKCTKCGREI
jgi:hypothetical protein